MGNDFFMVVAWSVTILNPNPNSGNFPPVFLPRRHIHSPASRMTSTPYLSIAQKTGRGDEKKGGNSVEQWIGKTGDKAGQGLLPIAI